MSTILIKIDIKNIDGQTDRIRQGEEITTDRQKWIVKINFMTDRHNITDKLEYQ